jgi:hypothetical protein
MLGHYSTLDVPGRITANLRHSLSTITIDDVFVVLDTIVEQRANCLWIKRALRHQ